MEAEPQEDCISKWLGPRGPSQVLLNGRANRFLDLRKPFDQNPFDQKLLGRAKNKNLASPNKPNNFDCNSWQTDRLGTALLANLTLPLRELGLTSDRSEAVRREAAVAFTSTGELLNASGLGARAAVRLREDYGETMGRLPKDHGKTAGVQMRFPGPAKRIWTRRAAGRLPED